MPIRCVTVDDRKYTCLIVEDDPAFVEILSIMVGKMDQVEIIDTCDNTVAAAKRIDVEKPDILLLDINISGLEGPEVLEITDFKPKTVVISSHPEDVMENYEVEFVSFIQKPLKNAAQLTQAIEACIQSLRG